VQLSISNIAWDIKNDIKVSEILASNDISCIDIAPGKYFSNPNEVSAKEVVKVKSFWGEHGIKVAGMQALLFGTKNLNIFGDLNCQRAMLSHLDSICRIAYHLESNFLVFGSPKNRDISGVESEKVNDIAIDFFNKLGDIAAKYGVYFCIEPNPECYESNFMMNSIDTLNIVKKTNHPNIKMQLDTGAITINNESIDNIISMTLNQIGHIHISEPNLKVVGDLNTNHTLYANAIKNKLLDKTICIEMLSDKNDKNFNSIRRALEYVKKIYK